jgi:predicted SAM-dependent methyltransferase
MRTPPIPPAVRRAVMRTWPYLRLRDVALRAHRDNMTVTREDLARRYLTGQGIEIGALIKPLRVPPGVTVRQVDYKSRADLIRDDGPGLRELGVDLDQIPEIDVVDDAGTLATFADASVDFVIANHVLEHLEDPIAGLHTFFRVLRPGGTLLLTLPDARRTFDARRARTSAAHVLRDHEEGPETSRREHYEEWARLIEGLPEDRVPERVAVYAREDARHHFHVWELEDFLALLRAVPLPCELLDARAYGIEFAVVLRKTPAQAPT